MNIAYWADNAHTNLHDVTMRLVCDDKSRSPILFVIVTGYFWYGYGDFYLYRSQSRFGSLKEAALHCETLAKSKGYRVLTEAERNLL